MKIKGIKKITIIVILSTLVFMILKVRNDIKNPFVTKNKNIVVNVTKGKSLFNVIEDLSNKGFIRSKNIFKLYVKIKKLNSNIKPGEYNIDSNIAIDEFIQMLNIGTSSKSSIKVTIPEGYNIDNIAALLEKNDVISKKEFLKSCINYKMPEYIKVNTKSKYSLEGYLFPDTYRFTKGINGNRIIDEMLKQFKIIIKDIEKKDNKKIDNIQRVITSASLIEKEARSEEDRGKISSVFNNRLKKGMKLQIDATVLYALGDHKKKLYIKDLKVNSPYNTYKIKGFPPGPICNPGRPSIEAALNPDKTDYIFYVLESNMKEHYFTNNYKKFLQAKQRYKKEIGK